jgi:hypothetical protein
VPQLVRSLDEPRQTIGRSSYLARFRFLADSAAGLRFLPEDAPGFSFLPADALGFRFPADDTPDFPFLEDDMASCCVLRELGPKFGSEFV